MALITRIEITSGEQATPKVIAVLSRVPRVPYIDMEILHDDGRRMEHHVRADSAEDRWSMAECLTHTFMGDRGRGADTTEFNRVLAMLAN